MLRLLWHRRVLLCVTRRHSAEQGNWVKLPNTFPSAGFGPGFCSCKHRVSVFSAKAGHWQAVMPRWEGETDAKVRVSALGYASQKTYKIAIVCDLRWISRTFRPKKAAAQAAAFLFHRGFSLGYSRSYSRRLSRISWQRKASSPSISPCASMAGPSQR